VEGCVLMSTSLAESAESLKPESLKPESLKPET
jgi:hypothetical protein